MRGGGEGQARGEQERPKEEEEKETEKGKEETGSTPKKGGWGRGQEVIVIINNTQQSTRGTKEEGRR